MAKQSDKNQNRKKRKKSSPKKLNLHCSVHFLDQSNQLFHLNARENGLELLNQVEKHLKLLEPKYFGLVYLDRDGNQCWLEANKSLSHQFKCSSGEIDLSFRVKFYVEHPARLAVEQTRWLFFLQSWIQTANGALETSPQTGCLLTSYFLQATLGPILSEAEDNLNISKLNPLPGFVRENVPVVIELRQLLKDQTADEAQNRFLDHIRRVDRYGVEFHPARDGQGKNIELGISGRAVTVHRAGIAKTRINTFAWCRILRVFYKRKRFFIQLQREKFEEYDTVVGFRAPSTRAAKRLWRSCTEQHSFFRTFRPINPLPPNSKPNKGISSLLKPLKSCFYDTGESGSASSGHHQSITYRRYDLHRVASTHPGGASVGSPSPRPAWSSAADETDEPLESSMDDLKTSLKMMVSHQHPFNYSSTCSGSAASPISSLAFKGPPSGSFNYADDSCATDGSSSSTHNSTAPEEISDQFQGRILGIPAPLPVDGVYQVRLEPDAEGLFGLNLRYENHYGHLGTARLSRLLPDSSADLCYPRLRIGDELLDVDGHPIECFKSQEELVRLFRNAAGQKTPLTLSLRRCRIIDPEEEIADAGRVIEYHSYNLTNGISAVESVERLSEELRNGRIISQFGLLAKSRPELSTSVARADANIDKNRYADIYPYDCNRIILGSSARFADLDYPGDDECQDYINASYITMPSSGAAGSNLLHYIATQGPLPHTVEDFWSLVWQEGVQTVAMVTPEEERGRVKCHRYWPEEDEIVRAGDLIVSCQFIRHSGHFIHRQLLLTHHQAEEEVRIVEHIQYLDWPDHGAPMSSSGQFIDYVRFARHLNSQQVDSGEDVIRPILVHCSAGIGRTGAFILLDSALSLLDAGMPVDPLNLVRLMRDQRPMMLQTSVQFQYVCDCIVDSFHQSH